MQEETFLIRIVNHCDKLAGEVILAQSLDVFRTQPDKAIKTWSDHAISRRMVPT